MSQEWNLSDCRACDGSGRVWYPGCGDGDTPCSACDGVGQLAKKTTTKGEHHE